MKTISSFKTRTRALSAGGRASLSLAMAVATGACLLLADAAQADTELLSSGSPARYLVPSDGSLGGTWRSRTFDDAAWPTGQNGIGYEVNPGAFSASVIADSQAEWSATGQQGENSWINGYYDKTGDLDGTYQAWDFQPYPRSEGPYGTDNYWTGGAWDWFNGNPPWDFLTALDIHPNSENNGGEHWAIRRWVSTTTGDITLRFHLRKSNLNGTGVTGKVFKNGVEIFTRTIAGNDGTGFTVYINTTAAEGDVFDFVNTPLGLGGDNTDGADGSILTATVLSGTVTPPPPPVEPQSVANSETDWSSTGVQGQGNWYYGYYNKTADADGTYDPNTDFNNTDPNWTFMGGTWQLGVDGNPGANPPWDTIGQTSWHPNGDNQPQGIHWVIRRWISEVDGPAYARVKFAKANTSGNGTTLRVLHNGNEIYKSTLNNTAGIDVNVPLTDLFVGDKIEFALDPLGVDGLFGDGSDSSTFTASIFTGQPPQSPVADSVADWGTAAQGENGWYYGYYNQTADADATYNPNTDFNNTDPNWTLSGGAWQLGVDGNPAANPPWDTIGQTDWHPNGDNQAQGVHWVIKRWVSDVDGDLHAKVQFGKSNTGGGNGTTLRVFHNGTQVFSKTVAFNDGTGINTNVALPGVLIGDTIEFALDPLGTDGGKGDGADGSYLRTTIVTGLPPEPPRPFVPGVADCIVTEIESQMKGINPSVYIRLPFNVSNPASIDTLKLKIKYNDGFAAYLNGVEIAKRNAPTSIAGITVADSIADWSTNPDVTVNGWSYGYYDQSLDVDGTYNGGADLTPFPHDGGGHSPTDFWTGTGYDWFAGNPPWTELFQEVTHPNGPNDGGVDPANVATHHQWTVRRWSATVDANLKCRVRFRKTNPGCGDGVRVSVFHNSTQVYSQTIAFNDSVGRDDTIELPDVFIGDTIDILLGPGDAGQDYCDGSAFSAVLFEGEPSIPWNGTATGTRTPAETLSGETLDLTGFISELVAGENVLAIQGFNAGVSDNEFVINAELLANQVPTAVNDAVAASAGGTTTFTAAQLLANDIDPDGDRLLIVGVSPNYVTAQGGTVRLYGDTIRYTPALGFTGPDTFQYTMTDRSGTPSRATVSVAVTEIPVNNPPSFTLAGASLSENSASARIVSGWAANISPGPAPYEASQTVTFLVSNDRPELFDVQPAITSSGTLTYTAKAGASGTATVTVRAQDNGGTDAGGVDTSAPQTFTIVLNVPLVCPTALPQTVSLNHDSTAAITLTANNAAGAAYAVSTPPAHGTLSGTPPNLTYAPAAGYCGTDSFTFAVTLAGCPASTATVSLNIACDNECPVAKATVQPPVWSSSSVVHFTVELNGANERPTPRQVPGTGTGTLSLVGNVLTVDVEYSGLTAGATAAHIHGPATTEQSAGVKLGLIPEMGAAGATSGTISGTATITDELKGQILAGLTYVNIHTPNYPGGEIRGQILLSHTSSYTVIAADGVAASLTLDASQSSDPDGDALTYRWFDQSTQPAVALGTGVTAPVSLAVGAHSVLLQVNDGQCDAWDVIQVEVITASEAIDQLIEAVNTSTIDRANKRPFIASLKAAGASFERGSTQSGLGQLLAFQNKVRAQVAPSNPDVAAEWIRMAQAIAAAVNAGQ